MPLKRWGTDMNHYIFPRTIFVTKTGIIRQLLHILLEFFEILKALIRGDLKHACHECYDLIQSVETLIRKLHRRSHEHNKLFYPMVVKIEVEEKNYARGYYDSVQVRIK